MISSLQIQSYLISIVPIKDFAATLAASSSKVIFIFLEMHSQWSIRIKCLWFHSLVLQISTINITVDI